jgi:hypothetical protein
MRAILILLALTCSASAYTPTKTETGDFLYNQCVDHQRVPERGPFSEMANAKAEHFCTCWAAVMATRINVERAKDDLDYIKQISAQVDNECNGD